MPIEEWEEVAVGAFSGSVASEGIEQQVTGSQDLPVLGSTDNSVIANALIGVGGVGMAWAGAKGMGPLARTESGRNFFAGFGASTLANPIVRKAFGVAKVGGARVEVSKPSAVTVSVGETEVTEETEVEAETPSGEALGGF